MPWLFRLCSREPTEVCKFSSWLQIFLHLVRFCVNGFSVWSQHHTQHANIAAEHTSGHVVHTHPGVPHLSHGAGQHQHFRAHRHQLQSHKPWYVLKERHHFIMLRERGWIMNQTVSSLACVFSLQMDLMEWASLTCLTTTWWIQTSSTSCPTPRQPPPFTLLAPTTTRGEMEARSVTFSPLSDKTKTVLNVYYRTWRFFFTCMTNNLLHQFCGIYAQIGV